MNAASAHSPRPAARALVSGQHLCRARRLARPRLHLGEPLLEQRALQPQTVAALDVRDQPAVAVVRRLGRSQPDRLPVEQPAELGPRLPGKGLRSGLLGPGCRHADAGEADGTPVTQAEQVARQHFRDRDRSFPAQRLAGIRRREGKRKHARRSEKEYARARHWLVTWVESGRLGNAAPATRPGPLHRLGPQHLKARAPGRTCGRSRQACRRRPRTLAQRRWRTRP